MAGTAVAQESDNSLEIINQRMNAPLWVPAEMSELSPACSNIKGSTNGDYRKSSEVNYQQAGWEKRISHDWQFFSGPAELGKVLVIDTDTSSATPAYRYLSNGTERDHFEPWSSSKVFAYTAAMAALRQQHKVGGNGYLGQYNIADLITSIHSYAPHGTADGDSNAIASYFANMAGRDFLTRLFHKDWLNLADGHVMFRGAYETSLLSPEPAVWRASADEQGSPYQIFAANGDDPGYLPYRCDNCGLTGNKTMTTLAMAEWLKRLAMHQADPQTRHPFLQAGDIDVLFTGHGHTDANLPTAGMMRGISLQLGMAIARALTLQPELNSEQAEKALNAVTGGKWRIHQKIGWGPSETRGTGENVMLAQVCLPLKTHTVSFTVAAQASYPGASDESVLRSGQKMQQLLDGAMLELLAKKNTVQP
ncbi:hypothetical protein DXV75_07510 [Alteromonas aestuariivivens]|uniref:Serine hydrolase n=1 Tax=Alteromonas aestuariivivens TaxID=1938339 RepID=A0A3D8MAH7_9ALTE|nr:hypothetical protein [Alteromonas aestuariivivens]RDV26824.1 hypothetical protein DXV75_07510 [Alteromonas aestuariivivens]